MLGQRTSFPWMGGRRSGRRGRGGRASLSAALLSGPADPGRLLAQRAGRRPDSRAGREAHRGGQTDHGPGQRRVRLQPPRHRPLCGGIPSGVASSRCVASGCCIPVAGSCRTAPAPAAAPRWPRCRR